MKRSLENDLQYHGDLKRDGKKFKVDIQANVTDELVQFIEENGGEIVFKSVQFDSIQAGVSPILLRLISERPEVFSISNPAMPIKNKMNTSQGAYSHQSIASQKLYKKYDGTGVKVGVLSDSAYNLAKVQSTGDLPSVTVFDVLNGGGEGTAMLEIVYDMAPKAQLYFASALINDAYFAENIVKLSNAGCQVIVDDVMYMNEPAFEDGPIAKAVTLVAKRGVAYFSAAGNGGNVQSSSSQTWEGDYVPNGIKKNAKGRQYKDYHLWTPKSTYNPIDGIPYYVSLQWADPYNSPVSDFDLFILDSTNTVVAVSAGSSKAFEGIQLPARRDYKILIARYSGDVKFMRVTFFGSGSLRYSTTGSVAGHAAAVGGFAVGAIPTTTIPFVTRACQGDKLAPEKFSSDGPRRMFFENGKPITPGNFLSTGGEVRLKPDFVAADGVSTATPGFASFYGTSAAAPHAAGLAALIFSAVPDIPLSTLRKIMIKSVVDIGPEGFDPASGAGVLDAMLIYQNLEKYIK